MTTCVRTFLAVLALIIWDASSAQAEPPPLHRFFLDYAVVKHSLKNDEGAFDELMELRDLDPYAADFVAEFWWSKAKRQCNALMKEVAERYARRVTATTSEVDQERIIKEARKEIDQCIYGVYYDHWDEINRMIKQRYESIRTK